jgi:hypothetical protein
MTNPESCRGTHEERRPRSYIAPRAATPSLTRCLRHPGPDQHDEQGGQDEGTGRCRVIGFEAAQPEVTSVEQAPRNQQVNPLIMNQIVLQAGPYPLRTHEARSRRAGILFPLVSALQ